MNNVTFDCSTAVITELTKEDVAECARLELALFPEDDPWSEASFISEIVKTYNHYFAARVNGTLVGYAGIAVLGTSGEKDCEIHTIAVDPTCQRAGVGAKLMQSLLAVADVDNCKTFLDVRTDNNAAIALYEKFGFSIVGLRKNYYRPSGADAHMMMRPASS